MSALTHVRLKELLSYDSKTGLFVRRLSRNKGNAKAGSVAGHKNEKGRIKIRVDNKKYYAHRLAWLYVYGQWPEKLIDHIDGNKENNSISNLREASNSENLQNQRKATSANKVGFLGVSRNKEKFVANIRINGILHYLGIFDTANQASDAYLIAKRKLHPFGNL